MREPRHIHRHSGYRRGTDTSAATRDSAQSVSGSVPVSVSGTPTKAMMARRGAGTGRLSPLVLRRAKYAVRSSSQTEDEEAKCQRVMNFQPTQEISLHSRCITAVRMSTDFDDPFIGKYLDILCEIIQHIILIRVLILFYFIYVNG